MKRVPILSLTLLALNAPIAAQTPPSSAPPSEKPADAAKPEPKPEQKPETPFIRSADPPKVAPTREMPALLTPTTAKGTPMPAARTPGVIPGVPKEDPSLPSRKFYPEGTFLSKRTGRLVKASTGDVVFVPARDAKGRGEAPMVLLPSQTLARLEAAPGVFADSTSVTISGEVYVYFDRQYLLPTLYTLDRQAPTSTQANPPATKPPAEAKPAETKTTSDADPAVADLIRELETKRGSAKAPEPTATAAAAAAQDSSESAKKPDGSVSAEGTVLFNRRARLVRVATGPLMVAFDGDTTSAAPAPMVLLRSRMAQKLDELAASRGDDLVLQVSGRVFVYDGRNYLMPTLAQVAPKGDVKSLQ
jgi:hypothetical protein